MNDKVSFSDAMTGLSQSQVNERVADGRINDVPDAPVRSTGEIIRANVLTPVNAIMGSLLVLILIAGFPGDALFAGVIVSNSVIGVAQELKARRTLNELAVLSSPKARVIRDGEETEISVSGVVADDLLSLLPGDQVVVDGTVVNELGLEIDESLLTGESDPVDKDINDSVLSGSFVSAGSGLYQATHIGGEAYASSLAEEARRFKLANSELKAGVNSILRWLFFIIPPASVLLLIRLLAEEDTWNEAIRGTVAGAVAAVPDGLVLLTSLSFIVGVVALARRQALAKELASVELLARVDVLCLDKTGTITTGEISFAGIEKLNDEDPTEALGAMVASDPNPNPTLSAIGTNCLDPEWTVEKVLPFSSARKWAATSFTDHGIYHLGAPDILLAPDALKERDQVKNYADLGKRVLVLTHTTEDLEDLEDLPEHREPIALVLLEDTIKEDAEEILAFFVEQGLTLKVISGDHPATVAAVAARAGIPGSDSGFDARDLPEDPSELAKVLEEQTVFGRVTPHQKRAMVSSLQSQGHTVAMTGDGVNDVLALKDADMGIAMGSGSSATRAVAQLVLLDDRFSTLPRVLAEGRRVINNIERVANLFICKAAYALLLILLVGIFGSPFPLLPKQLTLIGSFSIGLPGFFLALAPDTSLVKSGFLKRVLYFSLPAGCTAGIATFIGYEIIRNSAASLDEARTAATIILLALGLSILISISRPLRSWKIGLAAAMALSYIFIMFNKTGQDFFELNLPPTSAWTTIIVCSLVGSFIVGVVSQVFTKTLN